MTAKEVQEGLFTLIEHKRLTVINEWDAAKQSGDDLTRDIYCPRVDLAIGPFNTSRNANDLWQNTNPADKIKEILRQKDWLPPNFKFNPNPRCSVAIEIEASKQGSKYFLGDIANASILGKIGIVIPVGDKIVKSFNRLRGYVDFATRVGKLPEAFRNYVILTEEQFKEVLTLL